MTFLLIRRYWREGGLLVGAALALAAWHSHTTALVQLGQARERARVADSVIAVLAHREAHLDTVYTKDTVRLRSALKETVTLRDTLLVHLTDTVTVKEFIARSESTIQACTDVVRTCEAQKAVLVQERDAWKAKALSIPPQHSDLLPRLLWGGVGVAVGVLVRR